MSEKINYDDVLGCPFCGKEPYIDTAMFGGHILARCANNSCTLSSVVFTFDSWQTRTESQLEKRVSELEEVLNECFEEAIAPLGAGITIKPDEKSEDLAQKVFKILENK